jgi:hypothetical protein
MPIKHRSSSYYVRGTSLKAGYTLVTFTRTATPYRDCVDGTRDHATYQKLFTL